MAASTWPHWELQLLHAAGLPTTDQNKNWLRLWNVYDAPTCDRNPLNTSHHAPGSVNCRALPSSKSAQAYASRDSSALAFSEQLNLTDYPDLRKALDTGTPPGDVEIDALLIDLQKWGSTRWREQVAQNAGVPTGQPPNGSAQQASVNVSGAWTHLHRVLSNEGHDTIIELQRAAASMRTIDRRLRRV